jgi:hypothetical protein
MELTKEAKELIKDNPQLINTLARILNSNIEDAISKYSRNSLEENIIIDDIKGLMQDSISDIEIKY